MIGVGNPFHCRHWSSVWADMEWSHSKKGIHHHPFLAYGHIGFQTFLVVSHCMGAHTWLTMHLKAVSQDLIGHGWLSLSCFVMKDNQQSLLDFGQVIESAGEAFEETNCSKMMLEVSGIRMMPRNWVLMMTCCYSTSFYAWKVQACCNWWSVQKMQELDRTVSSVFHGAHWGTYHRQSTICLHKILAWRMWNTTSGSKTIHVL